MVTVWQVPMMQPVAHSGAEICPTCGVRLSSVVELIQHVDDAHGGGHVSQSAAQGMERCPHCSRMFPDAVALVQHVERHHASSPTCVLC